MSIEGWKDLPPLQRGELCPPFEIVLRDADPVDALYASATFAASRAMFGKLVSMSHSEDPIPGLTISAASGRMYE
jgi:hypothetical protein